MGSVKVRLALAALSARPPGVNKLCVCNASVAVGAASEVLTGRRACQANFYVRYTALIPRITILAVVVFFPLSLSDLMVLQSWG